MRIQIQTLLILGLGLSSCLQKLAIKEGLETHFTTIQGKENQHKKIWFQDSSVIFERWVYREFEINDTLTRSGYELWKYTYMDLKTMKCQDHSKFIDTAKPLNNYYLLPHEQIEWGFYNNTGFNSNPDSTEQIGDTTINRVIFNRWVSTNPQMGAYKFVLFVVCNSPVSIFKADRAFEKRHPGCVVKRIDLVNGEGKQESSFEYGIVRTRLTKEEKAVFKYWKKNAKNTLLPLLSYKESFTTPMYPIQKE